MANNLTGAFIPPNRDLANKTLRIDSLTLGITDPDDVAELFPLLEESLKAITSGVYPDLITITGKSGPGTAEFETQSGKNISGSFEEIEVTRKYPVTFFPLNGSLLCILPNSQRVTLPGENVSSETLEKLIARNKFLGLTPPNKTSKSLSSRIPIFERRFVCWSRFESS